MIHLALLGMAAFNLPIDLSTIPEWTAGWEVLWVPAVLALAVGPVFLLVAAQASLMQRWFDAAPEAGNPYPLYAASNLGSFTGLLAYPVWLEPRMSLSAQSQLWSYGYFVVIALTALAAATRWNVPNAKTSPPAPVPADRPDARRILHWLALAAVPSGLMLSTTTLLTTDIMAMLLLWVIPLGVYLLSFAVAFSDGGDWTRVLTRQAPVLLLLCGSLAMLSGGQANPAIAFAMTGLLFVLSVALHGRLYALRPEPSGLTFYYLILAAGGAIGGVFTALLAPVLFDWVYEHPILLLAAAILLPQKPFFQPLKRLWHNSSKRKPLAGALIVVAGLLTWQLTAATREGNGTQIFALVCTLALIGTMFIGFRWVYVTVLALLMAGHGGFATLKLSLEGARSRTYFGVYSVTETETGKLRLLSHGTTLHGQQWLDPARRRQPTSYYGNSSGIGIALNDAAADAEIGVVGLGTGTLACYRRPEQDWTFFEIDPVVVEYSQNGAFTFLSDCAPDADVVIGDARLKLAQEQRGRFNLLAIDAFTSDAIPLHLMTKEAFATYGQALDKDGLLMMHVSNRFIDLAPMISALAKAKGWSGSVRYDTGEVAEGLTRSVWIALSRNSDTISDLERGSPLDWEPLPSPARRAWTDDNASILPLIRW